MLSSSALNPSVLSPSTLQYDAKAIHIPGSIQSHGILLAFSESELRILQVSENAQMHLGISAQELLGQTLSVLFTAEQIDEIQHCLVENLGSVNCLKLRIATRHQSEQNRFAGDANIICFDGMIHRTENAAIVELERSHPDADTLELSLQRLANRAIAKLQKISDLTQFLQSTVDEIRQISGFDRVHIYKFDQQGAGSVIVEAKGTGLPSYLGLHFPESDIPLAARELYKRFPLRCTPNVSAVSSLLLSLEDEQDPLDLSLAILRSVDPCCVQYYENMGSAAFLVLSIIKDQQLWGLISCHHQSPISLPYELRNACEWIGKFVALELSKKINYQELDNLVHFKSVHSEFLESIAQVNSLSEALVNPAPRLLELVGAQGAAVCLEEDITLVGKTPTQQQISDLVEWTQRQGNESLFHTNSLPKLYPKAEAFRETASGLLLLRISKVRRYYVLWFRSEVLQTVNWAGNPSESWQVDEKGAVTLCPRTSFALWQETVRFTSLPWKSYELTNALDLRNSIVGIVLTKADELAKMNRELERSNRELDAFAFAASHDLKEPLRGIHNYSIILQEDYAKTLDEEGVEYLQTIAILTRRMDALIDVLMQFSQLGQAELNLQLTDMNDLLNQAIELLRVSRPEWALEIKIPRKLPQVQCDAVLFNELFNNLLSNAFKYNDKPQKWVEIGFLDPENQVEKGFIQPHEVSQVHTIFYFQDNGIGMRSHHLEIVFKLFKRLHAQEAYGGGAGAGLTIARKVVERHGGKIWVESIYGEGSTFYFTLA